MTKPLRVLIVDDSQTDAELLLRQLRQGGYDPIFERVDTAEAMSAALDQQDWEVIISDYVMPRFSGPDALKLVKERGIDVPFVVVSGQMGEDTAVETMKLGAHDYIVKGSLSRLVPAVERELREAVVRRERRETDEALKTAHAELREAHAVLERRVEERTVELARANRELQAEIAERQQIEKEREELLARLREANTMLTIAGVRATEKAQEAEERNAEWQALFESITDPIYVLEEPGRLTAANRAGLEMLGLEHLEELGDNLAHLQRVFDLRDPDGQPVAPGQRPSNIALSGETYRNLAYQLVNVKGQAFDLLVSGGPMSGAGNGARRSLQICRDVTEIRQLQRAQETYIDELQRLGEERERLLEELQTERALLQAVFQQMPAGVLVAEASTGKVIIANEQSSSILPAPLLPAADIQQYLGNLGFYADGRSYAPDKWPLSRAILTGEVVSGEEIEFVRADGTRGVAAHNAAPIRDRQGRIVAGVLVFYDITERKQAERLREEYLHLISHDLRNPLTGLMGHAQLLARALTQLDMGVEANRAEHIVYNARRMNEMIQDLVESSRLETGQLELHKDVTNLLDLMSGLSQRIGTLEDQQRINVVSSEWVPPVAVDLSRIERAFTNIISNALKYSSAQDPVVIEVARQDGAAVVCVRDQGVGIASDELPKLFQRFYRAKSGSRQEGIGLGLYIARLIVEAHGGRIWVTSEVGRGSAFHIALPVA